MTTAWRVATQLAPPLPLKIRVADGEKMMCAVRKKA
jgi:hypothetical protein